MLLGSLVSEGIALFAYLAQQVPARHEKGPSKKIGRFLFVIVRQAVGIDDAVGKFVCEGESPPLQRELAIDHNYGQPGGPRHLVPC